MVELSRYLETNELVCVLPSVVFIVVSVSDDVYLAAFQVQRVNPERKVNQMCGMGIMPSGACGKQLVCSRSFVLTWALSCVEEAKILPRTAAQLWSRQVFK